MRNEWSGEKVERKRRCQNVAGIKKKKKKGIVERKSNEMSERMCERMKVRH